MDVLYIAYSCSPNHGSEDRIGWMLPLESSRYNNVTVITKEEHRTAIQEYINQHSEISIKFVYVDIPHIYKKIYKGAAYSGRLKHWQKRALHIAEGICSSCHIDVIHQITPVEFRSMGDYGRIPGIRYVCGPLGGGEYIPHGLEGYVGGNCFTELLRRFLNRRAVKKLKRNGSLERCSSLLFSNAETRSYVCGEQNNCLLMSEVGIGENEIKAVPATKSKKCVFLVAGRLNYRKGHAFLIDALATLPKEEDWECLIVGNGPRQKSISKRCRKLLPEGKVQIMGRVAFDEMQAIYSRATALVLPSLRETTGSVLLEAMGNGLPVITVKRFGGAVLADESCAVFYDGHDKKSFIEGLSAALLECIHHPERMEYKSRGALLRARQFTWTNKAEFYNSLYHN